MARTSFLGYSCSTARIDLSVFKASLARTGQVDFRPTTARNVELGFMRPMADLSP
jgi:hypothetical protein